MEKRITLDNPEFIGKLRSYERSRAYVRPPVARRPPSRKSKTYTTHISDIVKLDTHAQPVSSIKVEAKEGYKHVELPKNQIHQVLAKQNLQPASGQRKSINTETKSLNLSQPNLATKVGPPRIVNSQQAPPIKEVSLEETFSNSKSDKIKTSKFSFKNTILYAMASVLFIFGAAVSINGLMTNHKAEAVVNKAKYSDNDSSKGSSNVPSAKKPSSSFIANYQVAPNMPRYIDVPSLSVHAVVLPMGVDQSNKLETPDNIYNAGWYNGSALPGQPGAMLVEAHSGIGNIPGLFHSLDKLTNGSLINITSGDGKVFTYKVVKQKTYDVKNVDMASMMVSQDTSKSGLNLISCAGDATPGTTEFSHRIIVYAVLQ